MAVNAIWKWFNFSQNTQYVSISHFCLLDQITALGYLNALFHEYIYHQFLYKTSHFDTQAILMYIQKCVPTYIRMYLLLP